MFDPFDPSSSDSGFFDPSSDKSVNGLPVVDGLVQLYYYPIKLIDSFLAPTKC